jgi:hypothetical protein
MRIEGGAGPPDPLGQGRRIGRLVAEALGLRLQIPQVKGLVLGRGD